MEGVEFGNSGGLSHLMQQKSMIKSAHIGQKRKFFDRQPIFIQAGLYLYAKYLNVRNQQFHPRLFVFEVLKEQGNSLFANCHYFDAARKYEEALSIFRYIRNSNPRWMNEEIEDIHLHFEDEQGETELEREKITSCKLLCYLNLAACYIKMKNSKVSIEACDEALNLDGNNIKALFRKAKAMILPSNSGSTHYQKAIILLEKAESLERNNLSIEKELGRYRAEMKIVRMKESANENRHAGFISGRGQQPLTSSLLALSTQTTPSSDPHIQLTNLAQSTTDPDYIPDFLSGFELSKTKLVIPEIDQLEKELGKQMEYASFMEVTGRAKEAEAFRKKFEDLQKIKKYINNILNRDFDRPTPELKERAKTYNLDLEDPLIKSELKKIVSENVSEIRRATRRKIERNPPTQQGGLEEEKESQIATSLPGALTTAEDILSSSTTVTTSIDTQPRQRNRNIEEHIRILTTAANISNAIPNLQHTSKFKYCYPFLITIAIISYLALSIYFGSPIF